MDSHHLNPNGPLVGLIRHYMIDTGANWSFGSNKTALGNGRYVHSVELSTGVPMRESEALVLVVSTRSKRENCKRTKHDSAFTDWKILVGPSDWEDHSSGKEGAARYRVHNLPNCSSCAGVYELGIAVSQTQSGRRSGKLEPDHIIPVYLGQADNVRSRLQRYGQTGAHLENGNSTGEIIDSIRKGPGLFSEIFSRGFPVVVRWAPMKDKRDAENTETQLLKTFDYAWNKGSNGARRPADILRKLNRSTSGTIRVPTIFRKLQTFRQKRVGISIEACKPLNLEHESKTNTNWEGSDLLFQILKFGKSSPRHVATRFDVNDGHGNVCGVALGQGSVCWRPPVKGRTRCSEHKGMKINGSISKLITEGKVYGNTESDITICGVTLSDGSPCGKQPIQGRKRCEEHKGRRIHGSVSKSVTEDKQHYIYGPVLESREKSQIFSERPVLKKECYTICGVDLKDGSFCTRRPVIGQKRCEKHKGLRVKESISKSSAAETPSMFGSSGLSTSNDRNYGNTSSKSVSYRNITDEGYTSTCGATCVDGSFCRRQPVEGGKRCWQHEGMRVISSPAYKPISSSYEGMSSHEGYTSTCGATCVDGSFCRRQPVEGGKRCWQHEGMRVISSPAYKPISSYECEGMSSHICGASLQNGSICRKTPVHGRKRCEQHKGKRAATTYY